MDLEAVLPLNSNQHSLRRRRMASVCESSTCGAATLRARNRPLNLRAEIGHNSTRSGLPYQLGSTISDAAHRPEVD
jgi:hypothetical protein